MVYDGVTAHLTLAGSLLSCIATFCVLLSFVVFRNQQRFSFRHALILNLTLAEFFNTLGNSISGSIYVTKKNLNPGPACSLNGFVGQLTVQAVDFTILAIGLVTLLTVTRKTYLPYVSKRTKTLICLSTWLVPVITSTIALSMDAMRPVRGNWCWITSTRPDLRYALTHGWRIAIIFLTILLYAYIWWFVHRHFKNLFESARGGRASYNPVTGAVCSDKHRPKWSQAVEESRSMTLVDENSENNYSRIVSAGGACRTPDSDSSGISLPIQGTEMLATEVQATETQATETQGRESSNGAKKSLCLGRLAAPVPSHVEWRRTQNQNWPFPESDTDRIQAKVTRSIDVHVSYAQDPSLPAQPQPAMPSSLSLTPHFETTISCSKVPASSTASFFWKRKRGLAKRTPEPGSRNRKLEHEIRRMLLLNAYPTFYVLLWLPGIVNRFMEATGKTPSNPRVMSALQSTSQFVGLANALTFGINVHLKRHIKSYTSRIKWSPRKRSDPWSTNT